MNIIKSERKELQLGLPEASAGGGCTGHWLGLADTRGALNMVPGWQGRKVMVTGGELGLGQGQQPQLNPDTWAIQVPYWSYTYTCTLTCT